MKKVRTTRGDSRRDILKSIGRMAPAHPEDRTRGCTLQQLRNLHDSLTGRTPRLFP